MSVALREIEERLPQLSFQERLALLERVARTLREEEPEARSWSASLAEMAADPDIRREMDAIDREFSVALNDGLDKA
jgi:hypothetical protein